MQIYGQKDLNLCYIQYKIITFSYPLLDLTQNTLKPYNQFIFSLSGHLFCRYINVSLFVGLTK